MLRSSAAAKRASIPTIIATQTAVTHQNCARVAAGKCGSGTFMPQIPASSVGGMKIVATTVSTFITSFSRLLTFERCASSIPVMRS